VRKIVKDEPGVIKIGQGRKKRTLHTAFPNQSRAEFTRACYTSPRCGQGRQSRLAWAYP
jgi:hypothetical protein